MGRSSKWSGKSSTAVEVLYRDGEWWLLDRVIPFETVKAVWLEFPKALQEVEYSDELEFPWDFDGYYDPGVTSGPPERCYPEEGEDNRTITGFSIGGKPASETLWKLLEKSHGDLLQERIDEGNLPEGYSDEPEPPDDDGEEDRIDDYEDDGSDVS